MEFVKKWHIFTEVENEKGKTKKKKKKKNYDSLPEDGFFI